MAQRERQACRRPPRKAVTSSPFQRIRPLEASPRRLIARSSVDLPAPDRPITPTNPPSATSRVKSATATLSPKRLFRPRSEEHTSELQSRRDLVCRLLLEKKKK